MNAQLKPIVTQVLQRPTYRSWNLVRDNKRAAWIMANLDLITAWYRDTGTYAPQEDPQASFAVFCDQQFECEYAQYEEHRADRDDRGGGYSNGSTDWSNC